MEKAAFGRQLKLKRLEGESRNQGRRNHHAWHGFELANP